MQRGTWGYISLSRPHWSVEESRIQLYMKCPTCGNGSPENAQFCAGCGAKLDEASSSDATSNPRPFPDILLIAIRIVLIAIGLGLALLLLTDETINQTIIPWLGASFLIAGLFIFPRQANQRGAIKVWLLGGLTGSVTGLLYFLANFFFDPNSYLSLGIALITTAVVAVLLAKATDSKIIILVVVAYLTLAAVFDWYRFYLDPDIWVLVRDARVGFVAGFVWITPFAIWALVSRGRTS